MSVYLQSKLNIQEIAMPSAAPAAATAAAAEEAPVEVRVTASLAVVLLTLFAGEAKGEDYIQH